MFFWNSLASSMIQRMLAIWSLVPLPFLNPVWTSGSSRFMYRWSLAWRILSITLLACEMSATVLQLSKGIAFLWDWNENWPFPVLWPLLSFPNLLAYGNCEMILNKIAFRIKPIPTRDVQRVQTNLVHTRTQRSHRDWTRTVFECLLQRYRSVVDCCRDRGSGYSRLGYGISPLGGDCHLPTIVAPELTQDWETDSWRAQTKSCLHQDPGERRSDPSGDWPRIVHESPVEIWVSGGLLQGWGHWVQQRMYGQSEGSRHYLPYLHHSLASGQTTAPPINRNLD